jgi:gluconolactonase
MHAIDLESGDWTVVIEYDDEPNGLAWHPQRQQIIIADFKSGLLALDPKSKLVAPITSRFNGEHFK